MHGKCKYKMKHPYLLETHNKTQIATFKQVQAATLYFLKTNTNDSQTCYDKVAFYKWKYKVKGIHMCVVM